MNFGSVLTFRVDSTVDARKVYFTRTWYILWPSFETFELDFYAKFNLCKSEFPHNQMKDYFKM